MIGYAASLVKGKVSLAEVIRKLVGEHAQSTPKGLVTSTPKIANHWREALGPSYQRIVLSFAPTRLKP